MVESTEEDAGSREQADLWVKQRREVTKYYTILSELSYRTQCVSALPDGYWELKKKTPVLSRYKIISAMAN